MKTARLFINGRSQAVRLPKDCRFAGSEVYIKKLNGIVLLIPKDDPWASLMDSLDHFSDDFMTDREQPAVQSREPM
jgi:antitoxin VapB